MTCVAKYKFTMTSASKLLPENLLEMCHFFSSADSSVWRLRWSIQENLFYPTCFFFKFLKLNYNWRIRRTVDIVIDICKEIHTSNWKQDVF